VTNSAAFQLKRGKPSLTNNSFWDVAVYSISEENAVYLLNLLFDCEDGGSTFLRNIGKLLLDFTASYSQKTAGLLYLFTAMRTSNITTFSKLRHSNTKSPDPVTKTVTDVMLKTVFNNVITKIWRHRVILAAV
jgi:hypothetical protein